MKANDFNKLVGNNCQAAIIAIQNKEIGFETVIGILESHKQALFDWRACWTAEQMRNQKPLIQPSSTLPANPT